MTPTALFVPDGPSRFVPTAAAVGPWDRRAIHGAAVAALLAGRLTPTEGTLARLTVEILAPVPHAPLTLTRRSGGGGRRVQRHTATIAVDDHEVATATSLVVRREHLELPATALDHPTPFEPAEVPPLDQPNRAAKATIGWESFDSQALIYTPLRVEGDRRYHQWVTLAMPIVEGTSLGGNELAAIAADYAQSAVNRQLPYDQWSFRNAELTIHLAREPEGGWMGVRCESVVAPVGTGFNASDLFDQSGRVGRSAATLVVEQKPSLEGDRPR